MEALQHGGVPDALSSLPETYVTAQVLHSANAGVPVKRTLHPCLLATGHALVVTCLL